MRTWRRKCKRAAGLRSKPQSQNTNEASGGGVWISEGAECAHFKENRHHEKDGIRFCLACHSSDELQPSAGAEASCQTRTGDANTGSIEAKHREDSATSADYE